jgi:hypothetical protein
MSTLIYVLRARATAFRARVVYYLVEYSDINMLRQTREKEQIANENMQIPQQMNKHAPYISSPKRG